MRALIVAAAALSLAACGNNDQTDNTGNVDENLSAENIVSNDVTAIDAVTGDAANMAADVDINFTTDQLATTDNRSGSKPPSGSARPAGTRPSASQTNTSASTPAPAPTTNTAGNTTE